jgi:uncharacterized protein
MIFHVAGLLREPVGSARRFAVPADGALHGGEVEFIRLPGGVLVRFAGEVTLEAECSRCLSLFAYVSPVTFEEIFVQQVDVATGARIAQEIESDPDAFRIGLDHTIDITEAVRQYGEMAAAMQPLCRPECPGLCPQCGQDLTAGTCTCERVTADSRWAALADLKLFPNG